MRNKYDLWNFVWIFVAFLITIALLVGFFAIVVLFMDSAYAEERSGWVYEVTGQYGASMDKDEYSGTTLHISAGRYINNWASIRAEGTIGSLAFDKYGSEIGASFIFRADPLISEKLRLFGELGIGIGYASVTPIPKNKMMTGAVGLIDAGTGIIFPIGYKDVDFVFGWKFSHISSLKANDSGMNTHGVVVGMRW